MLRMRFASQTPLPPTPALFCGSGFSVAGVAGATEGVRDR
jgi:hypothetical protein